MPVVLLGPCACFLAIFADDAPLNVFPVVDQGGGMDEDVSATLAEATALREALKL